MRQYLFLFFVLFIFCVDILKIIAKEAKNKKVASILRKSSVAKELFWVAYTQGDWQKDARFKRELWVSICKLSFDINFNFFCRLIPSLLVLIMY